MQMLQTIDFADQILPHQMPDTPTTQAMNLFELYGDLPHKNPNYFKAQGNLKPIYKPNGIYGSQLDQF